MITSCCWTIRSNLFDCSLDCAYRRRGRAEHGELIRLAELGRWGPGNRIRRAAGRTTGRSEEDVIHSFADVVDSVTGSRHRPGTQCGTARGRRWARGLPDLRRGAERDFAAKIQDASPPALQYFTSLQDERRLTLQQIAGGPSDRAAVVEQRAVVDVAAGQVLDAVSRLEGDAPAGVKQSIGLQAKLIGGLPQFRRQVDAGEIPLLEAYAYYNTMLDEFASGLNGIAQNASDAEIAYLKITALPLFTSADGMQRGDALAAAGVAGDGLNEAEFRTYLGQIGAYHTVVEGSAARMLPEVRARYDQLIAGDAWNKLVTVENAFLRGNQTELPIPEDQWRAAAREVGDTLMTLYFQQSGAGTDLAIERGEDTLLTSLIAGVAALLLAIGVFLFALRLSNRLVRRLARLRSRPRWTKPRPGRGRGRSSSTSRTATRSSCTASSRCSTRRSASRRTPNSSTPCSNSIASPPAPAATPRTSSFSAGSSLDGSGAILSDSRNSCGAPRPRPRTSPG
jgi:hypothetical protein